MQCRLSGCRGRLSDWHCDEASVIASGSLLNDSVTFDWITHTTLILYFTLICKNGDKMQPITHTHTQPFYGSVDFVWDNPGEPVPEETFTHSHSSWSSIILICFLHLLRSMVSSLFNPRALQSFSTISLQVFFGLPLGLAASTSYSIHFFTQSLSSFRNTCPYHRNPELEGAQRVHISAKWILYEITGLKNIRITTLNSEGHVTSSITWPLDTAHAISYRCPVVAESLSRAVFEISK